MELKFVVVLWHDAYQPEDYQKDPAKEAHVYPIQTVGVLLRDDAEFVVVSGEVLPEGEGHRNVSVIPRAMVQSVRTLTLACACTTDGTLCYLHTPPFADLVQAPVVAHEHTLGLPCPQAGCPVGKF